MTEGHVTLKGLKGVRMRNRKLAAGSDSNFRVHLVFNYYFVVFIYFLLLFSVSIRYFHRVSRLFEFLSYCLRVLYVFSDVFTLSFQF